MADGRKNLIPITETEDAKAKGKLGGIESGKAKRKKKIISEIYQEFLKTKEGQKLIDLSVRKALNSSAPVPMLKEIREATEGSKVINELTDGDGNPLQFVVNINPAKPKE